MPTDVATLNSYNEHAQGWSERLRAKENLAHEFLEKPAMYGKLPDLHGKRVLSVGCGSGDECQRLKEMGALDVVGIDLSPALIELARQNYPGIQFELMDMENISLPEKSFDIVFCSLTIHYVEDWHKALQSMKNVLTDDGTLLISTHHPVKWAAEIQRGDDKDVFLMGYEKFKHEDKCVVYGDYLNRHKRTDKWFDELEITYYHKPFSEILREFRETDLEIIDFIEPKPIPEVKERRQSFWDIHQRIPQFMIFELQKKR